jgi:uncharacterized membrane protein YjjP (DUF1212 family)
MRLSRPVYESVPLIYFAIGACGFVLAYFDPEWVRSIVAFCIGLISAVAALTVFLHRQDHRDLSREYTGETIDFPSSLGG